MKDAATVLEVQPAEAGMRLDAFVAKRGLGLTRSQVEKLIRAGSVRVNGMRAKQGARLEAGDRVEVESSTTRAPASEPVPLDILFEDDQVLVVNKQQGLVVHPAPGHRTGTLVDALLARNPRLTRVGAPGRPGIVHRLDKDTSGLMVVAKTEAAYEELARQVRERELERRYLALIWGRMQEDRLIMETPIGRKPSDPTRMVAAPDSTGKRDVRSARTEIRVLERLGEMTLVEARIATGRTHQIRVHLAHQGYPVVGDRVYGLRGARQGKVMLDVETLSLVTALPGQALHAQTLLFRHPVTRQTLSFSVPAPRQMANLLAHLRRIGPG